MSIQRVILKRYAVIISSNIDPIFYFERVKQRIQIMFKPFWPVYTTLHSYSGEFISHLLHHLILVSRGQSELFWVGIQQILNFDTYTRLLLGRGTILTRTSIREEFVKLVKVFKVAIQKIQKMLVWEKEFISNINDNLDGNLK